jgi:hypothetical protein
MKVVVVALLFATACGGESTESRPDATGGKGSGASGGGGGSAASGGSSGGSDGATGGSGGATGGTGGRGGTDPVSPDCDPNEIQPGCVAHCGVEPYDWIAAVCADGSWVCPSGTTYLESCAENTCSRDHGLCCDTTIGVLTTMECEDGVRPECPAPLDEAQASGGCMPEGVVECSTLDGKACSSTVEECHNAGRCSTSCDCELGADGNLAWRCWTLLC